MIKPYYETKLGKLYLGNCLDILPELGQADIILTDPPYGMGYHSGRYKYDNPYKKIVGDDKFPSELIPIFKEKARKAVFCFCRWDNLHEVEKPTSFIVWVKNNWSAGDLKNECGRMWEGILFYPLEKHDFKKRMPDVIDFKRVPPTKIYHPTQKPVLLIDWLLRHTTEKMDIVLDPFAGSSTTAIACEGIGRQWIMIEISEEYAELSAKRIEAEASQLKLFT